MNAIVPIPRCDVNVRLATPDDVPFIDSLQKMHAKQVGFLRTSWIENRIARKQVLVAVEGATGAPVGYIIAQDKYQKRDELGIVLQLNVLRGSHRKLIGATLLKAAFDRASYGCLLFCCWCAQDIEANRFWEAMGFVPLAFRAGSGKKSRLHIFWQKRIREGDGRTPWWYPCETTGGAMNEGRLVFPIPPEKHWSDEMPIILPAAKAAPKLEGPKSPRGPRSKTPSPAGPLTTAMTGMRFAPLAPAKPEKKPREKTPKAKNDPKLVAMTREFRDRWLERLNESNLIGSGKYDVTRILPAPRKRKSPAALLPAA